jgi:hypothetical protein
MGGVVARSEVAGEDQLRPSGESFATKPFWDGEGPLDGPPLNSVWNAPGVTGKPSPARPATHT